MQGPTNNRSISRESSGEDEKPFPPRYWWLKRGAMGFSLLLVMLCVLRFWWGREARRQIEALARETHARGEPFYPEDYRQARVPDAENAAIPIEAAERKLWADGYEVPSQAMDMPAFFGWSSHVRVEPPSPEELPKLKSFIQRYQNAIRLLRLVRGRPKVLFSTRPNGMPLPPGMYFGSLGHFLDMAANYEHATADDREAVEYAHDAIVFADVLECARPGDIWDAPRIDVDTVHLLERIAPQLSISSTAGENTSPQAVRSLIAALLDEAAMRTVAIREGESSAMLVFDNFAWPSASGVDRIATRVLDPMHVIDGVRVAKVISANAEALKEPTYPAAKAKWKDFPSIDYDSAIGKLVHPIIVKSVSYPPELTMGGYFKVLTERRVVAIMLAIRLYKSDHQNKLPASLSELVPTYLPAVPRDPFDSANGPIRYLPKRDPPALYSVGFNGKDDGGSEKYLIFLKQVDARWRYEDVIFPLPPQPVSPAQNHRSEKKK